MKQNEINDSSITSLTPQNMENIFNVYVDDNGTYFYNILKTINFPKDLDATVYSEYYVEPGDTWPLISWKFYTNVRLWWIICASNNIINPVAQPSPGTVIKIINLDIVREILSQLGSS